MGSCLVTPCIPSPRGRIDGQRANLHPRDVPHVLERLGTQSTSNKPRHQHLLPFLWSNIAPCRCHPPRPEQRGPRKTSRTVPTVPTAAPETRAQLTVTQSLTSLGTARYLSPTGTTSLLVSGLSQLGGASTPHTRALRAPQSPQQRPALKELFSSINLRYSVAISFTAEYYQDKELFLIRIITQNCLG